MVRDVPKILKSRIPKPIISKIFLVKSRLDSQCYKLNLAFARLFDILWFGSATQLTRHVAYINLNHICVIVLCFAKIQLKNN